MPDDADTRRSFVSRAAFLRREMQGRETKRDYLQTGRPKEDKPGRLIYIFDTSVVVSYCAPWIAGPLKSDGSGGFGVVFPAAWAVGDGTEQIRDGLDPRHATLVLQTVAEFALIDAPNGSKRIARRGLRDDADFPRQPVLMFPAHYDETGKIYRVVADQARNQGQSTGTEEVFRREARLATNALALLKSTKDAYDSQSEISGRALGIVDYLINRQAQWRLKGAVREWDRYVRLSTQTGGIYSARDGGRFFDDVESAQEAFQVLDGNLHNDEQGLRTDLVGYWRRQLLRQKPGGKPDNQQTDAEALADLFLINHRLEAALSNARVCLVTSDENLVRATYGGISLAKVSLDEPRLRDVLIGSAPKTASAFSQRYISHLWGFMGEVFASKDADGPDHGSMTDFFNGLLAKGAEPTRFPLGITERIALFPEDFRDLSPSQARINQTLKDWLVLTTSSTRQFALSEIAINDELRHTILKIILHESAEKLSWHTVLSLVQEQIDREQDRLTTNLSDTGIAPLLKGGLLGTRNPPDLYFASFPKTQLIFEKLARGIYSEASQFERDFADIRGDCLVPVNQGQEDDRQLSYLRYVVLGAAFASADKWSVALEHAIMAAAIPERARSPISMIPYQKGPDGDEKFIAGREAYFLAAVAQRVMSEAPHELERARVYLDRAAAAVSQKTSGARLERHAMRFEGERFAQALSEYYLASIQNPSSPNTTQFNKVILRCKNILRLSMDQPTHVPFGDVVRVSIATNVIQTAVLSAQRAEGIGSEKNECPEALAALPDCLETISNLVNLPRLLQKRTSRTSERLLVCSNLTAAYYFAGALLLNNRDRFNFLRRRGSVDRFLPSPGRSSVTVYDRWRYEQLYAFCKVLWARSG